MHKFGSNYIIFTYQTRSNYHRFVFVGNRIILEKSYLLIFIYLKFLNLFNWKKKKIIIFLRTHFEFKWMKDFLF